MPAFNARLRPKDLFGLPVWGVISGLIALACGFMAMVFPVVAVKVLLGLIAVAALIAMFALFALGEELVFLRVRLQAKREDNSLTYEVGRERQ